MYITILIALGGLSCLKLLPSNSPYTKYSTSLPLLFCILFSILSSVINILSTDPDFSTPEPYLSILKEISYSEYHTICINFICWLQLIPYFYFSPDLTYNFETFNSVQYNYAALFLFEVDPKFKFYFLVNLASLLVIQILNKMITSDKAAYKVTEILIQTAVLQATYDWGFGVTVLFIVKNFVLPILSSGLAVFLEFFTFIYFFETLNDYSGFYFPEDARLRQGRRGKGKAKIGPFDIFSHAYAFPVIFLIFFRLISDVSSFMMLHIFVLISIPLSFKLSLICRNFDSKSFALNTVAIFFSFVCYLFILGFFN